MNNKGFTLVEILAAVVILGILSTMAIAGYTRYIDYSKNKSYKHMAKSAMTAAEEYLMDNPSIAVATKIVDTPNGKRYEIADPNANGVLFSTLIEEGYLNGASDPDSKGNDCQGRVIIGLIEATSKAALDQYMYVIDQSCVNHNARYIYTVEVDETGNVKTVEEVEQTSTPFYKEEIAYCHYMTGGGYGTNGVRTKSYLKTENVQVSDLLVDDSEKLKNSYYVKADSPIIQCLRNNGTDCIQLGTAGVDYDAITINGTALPATSGCYVAFYTCLSGETEVEVYDKKKKKRMKKKLKDITPDDLILGWDFDKGDYVFIEPLWIKQIEIVESYYLVKFSDGSFLEVIGDHRIFNCEENRFIRVIDETNVGTHTINSKGEQVEIISIEEIKEKNTSCNVITKEHINLFANGILTSWAYNNLYPIKDMKYQKQDNITFTKEDLKDIPERLIEGLRLTEIPVELMGSKEKTLESIKTDIDKILNKEQRF